MGHDPLAPYRILFALLAREDLVAAPAPIVATSAGVAPEDVGPVLSSLEAEGFVGGSPDRTLLRADQLLDRWVAGYAAVVRPRLLLARYDRTPGTTEALERDIEHLLGGTPGWAFGGAAAAYRVTRMFRGHLTVLHLAEPRADLPDRLGLVPHPEGRLVVLGVPGPLAFEGVRPHLAHPLLVYTEMQI